jgi:hypothetical protein
VEAKPEFGLIARLPDAAFVRSCAPTLTTEEFNVFKESNILCPATLGLTGHIYFYKPVKKSKINGGLKYDL